MAAKRCSWLWCSAFVTVAGGGCARWGYEQDALEFNSGSGGFVDVGAVGVDGGTTDFDEPIGGAGMADADTGAEVPADTGASSVDWWDTRFRRRTRIVLDNGTQNETLLDFPVAVLLGPDALDYTAAKSAGEDVRLVDSDGATLLDHEIESWNVAGQTVLWVRVPRLLASSDEGFLWLYYGNPSALDSQNPPGVWSNDYVGVWHLDPAAVDSSLASYVGAITGAASVSGQTGGARRFSAAGEHIDLGSPAGLDNLFYDGGTVVAWINATSYGGLGFGRILDKSLSVLGESGWALQLETIGAGQLGSLRFEHDFSARRGAWGTGGATIQLSTWHHVAVSFNSTSSLNDPVLYVDGSATASLEMESPLGQRVDDSGIDLWMGDFPGIGDRHFDGTIDEVRVSRVVRSDDWIRAEFLSSAGALSRPGAASSLD